MNFENEKYEYLLHVNGPMFDTPAIAQAGIKPGRYFFGSINELWYFHAELQIMRDKQKAARLNYEVRQGKDVRFYSVVNLLLLHDYKTYPISYEYDKVYNEAELKKIFSDKGEADCDCVRSALIRKQFKEEGVEIINCGRTIELLNFKVEYGRHKDLLNDFETPATPIDSETPEEKKSKVAIGALKKLNELMKNNSLDVEKMQEIIKDALLITK